MPSVADLFETMDYGPAPEGDGPVRAWLDRHQQGTFGHFIGGTFTTAGTLFEVRNPATSAPLARVTQGTDADVDAAVTAARLALAGWQALGGHGRARHLYALARAVQKHARLLAVLETLDNGKPIRETRDIDIPLVARHFYHHAGTTPRRRICRLFRRRGLRADHSVEFSAADAGMEGGAGPRRRLHRRAQARRIHTADRALFCGAGAGGRVAGGCAEHRHR
jgi:hypothetical protein